MKIILPIYFSNKVYESFLFHLCIDYKRNYKNTHAHTRMRAHTHTHTHTHTYTHARAHTHTHMSINAELFWIKNIIQYIQSIRFLTYMLLLCCKVLFGKLIKMFTHTHTHTLTPLNSLVIYFDSIVVFLVGTQ